MLPQKEARKANYIKKIMKGNELTRSTSLQKRLPTLNKKAFELQTLCDVSVCVVSSGADGKVITHWPEDPKQARDAIEAYRSVGREKMGEMTVLGFLEQRKRDANKKRLAAQMRNLAQQLSDWIDGMPPERDALANAAGLLESKIAELEKMREILRVEGKEQKALAETESGDESSGDDDDDESNEEEINKQISSEQARKAASQPSASVDYSLENGAHQPIAISCNNGGLTDLVQSYPQQPLGADVGEQSFPVWQSETSFVDHGSLMMLDDTLPPLFSDSQGIQFQNCAGGGGHVLGWYPDVSPLHEALPFNVWAPRYY